MGSGNDDTVDLILSGFKDAMFVLWDVVKMMCAEVYTGMIKSLKMMFKGFK